ncbi:hypothetical protein [Microcoleus sp. bin38.metabat.b11b12b14.051]|uniref:hypothetical protein n=1 Tax=Microcoleus sp. bin38.metabat.b11b12b14.051 TaxID=2742709 RepID=UPI0025FDD4E9|nr:hypothetical protein [Microcoleus sp. bin38.metabat.b11b12b14.051]
MGEESVIVSLQTLNARSPFNANDDEISCTKLDCACDRSFEKLCDRLGKYGYNLSQVRAILQRSGDRLIPAFSNAGRSSD